MRIGGTVFVRFITCTQHSRPDTRYKLYGITVLRYYAHQMGKRVIDRGSQKRQTGRHQKDAPGLLPIEAIQPAYGVFSNFSLKNTSHLS